MSEQAGGRPWWEGAVIYQVYPRSFQDGDGDGVGDLAGIERRLDYFVELGVDALWLSPIFPSPQADFGYDVADYCGVDPLFGDLEAFDRLLAAAHRRGLRLLLDLVPNHSSDRHPWFVESRSSRTDAKRDWYIWRDPAPGGGPPNNWISDMGGSAWTFDPATGQYYYHAFLPQQPDLNWRNPEVRAAMLDVLRFWFDRGVDGFRIDVLWHIVKHSGFPDNPANEEWRQGDPHHLSVHQLHSTDQPEALEIAAEMRALANDYGARVLVGEIYLPVERLVAYYGPPERPGVHLPFNFQLIGAEWDAPSIARMIEDYEAALPPGGWPNWVLGNHDRPRIATRVGQAQAGIAMMLLLTLRGTPTLYQGDELGLEDVPIPPDRVQDPRELRQPGIGLGRDPVRSPMAWDSSPYAGFSTAEPWLPLHPDWKTRNAAAQREEANSLWRLTQRLLGLRRARPALALGDIRVLTGNERVLAYERTYGGERLMVLLNLTPENVTFDWGGTPLLSTLDGEPEPGMLFAGEGVIIA
jgi:alpha-glucosidase